MRDSLTLRMAFWLAVYFALVLVAGLLFDYVRLGVPDGSPIRYSYILFGPALALFTHMGLFLFVVQSLLLLPWLVLAAVRPEKQTMALVAFSGCWFAIGAYMYNLF